jgi:predicted ribosome quality control (RQC) complex YloA/Tae2 family protein
MRIEFNKTWFVIGKNSEDNWKIISEADKDYYWVHADSIPSAHIIIEVDQILDDEIQYACKLCKIHSKKITNFPAKFVLTQVKNLRYGSKPGEVYFKDNTKVKNIILNN